MHEDGILVADEVTGVVRAAVLPVALPVPVAVRAEPATAAPGWLGKRVLDVVLSAVLLVLTLPLFLVLAGVIKATSRGPVFFRQRRVGRGGDDFPMLKFRTMHADSEERLRTDADLRARFLQGSHKIPSRLDPRVTGVGRVLRRLSLDELPQLLNVLSGDMSIVGPRPVERSQLLRDYGAYESTYLALRPGLTGLWQVSGRSRVQFPERAQLDHRYLHSCGPWTDAKIMLRTPRAIVTGLGAD
jgi:lipopolysaccharide/colanic/teichoic acid biosynthesis glycosyltransferase